MKLLGKGMFSRAYLQDNGTVLLKSIDPVRECQALDWFPDSPFFPRVTFGEQEGTYIMPYYAPVTAPKQALNSEHYAMYSELRALGRTSGYQACYLAFKTITDVDLRKALQDAYEALINFGDDFCFEISPRNIAVVDGKLILRDCFFFSKLIKKRSNKR